MCSTSHTSIRVDFPTSWPGWNIPTLTLSRQPPLGNTQVQLLARVDPNFHCDYSSDSPVFRATTSSGMEVALKFAMRDDLVDDLAHEAHVYERPLLGLQGKTVPRCFGLYTGVGAEGQDIACLVLEFWGRCLEQRFGDLNVELRALIIDRLNEIHHCGLHHGDFAERNVLVNPTDDDIRIIDFDRTFPCGGDNCSDDEADDSLPVTPSEDLDGSSADSCGWLKQICHDEKLLSKEDEGQADREEG